VSTDIRSVAVVDEAGAVVAAGPGAAGADAAAAIASLWDAAGLNAGASGDSGLEHVVVPVSARHRGHQGDATGQAEDLVQWRDRSHARIREGLVTMGEVCRDTSPLAS